MTMNSVYVFVNAFYLYTFRLIFLYNLIKINVFIKVIFIH